MVSPELWHFQVSSISSSAMVKHGGRRALSVFSDGFLFVAGAMVALVVVWAFSVFLSPVPNPSPKISAGKTEPKTLISNVGFSPSNTCAGDSKGFNLRYDSPEPNFYDDPTLSYSIEKTVKNWDEKRQQWLKQNPSFSAGSEERVLVLTGSQSKPCTNPIGDHVLLRFFKNKVDYCRIHGYDIFYNNVLLHPQMHTYWAKIPTIRSAMLAHPEAEWLWWVDSDAAFTDMDFKLPLARYKNHNLVVHGWPRLIYEKKSWTSLNAGVFLIRNCQWSLDFMDTWASMGPQTPNYDKWGEILRSTCKDKFFPESDDQTGLVYLLLEEREKWGDKVYVESEYYFEGYWLEIVETLENIADKYLGVEKREKRLRRRHAEKVSEAYTPAREAYLKEAGYGKGSWRRPFITHFTGCQPCSGQHNQLYSGQSCFEAMQKALNFADNQVLRRYGFVHPSIADSSTVSPLPFDFPA